MKRIATVLAVGALAGSLAGCGAGNAGVALRVGDESVSVERITDLVTLAFEDRQVRTQYNGQQPRYIREVVLDRYVDRLLVEEAARRLGVTIDESKVDAEVARIQEAARRENTTLEKVAAAEAIAPDEIRRSLRVPFLREAVADKLVENERPSEQQIHRLDRVTIQHIVVRDKAVADRVLAELRRGARFDDMARRHSLQATTKDQGGRLPALPGGGLPAAMDRLAFSVPLNTPAGPARSDIGWHVFQVLDRDVVPRDRLTAEQRKEALGELRQQRYTEYVSNLARELGVRINPRFGRWNPQTGAVEAPVDALSSTSPPPGGNPSGPPPGFGDPQGGQGGAGQGGAPPPNG